ncbi:NAD(P)-dependent oxidoreductase [Actinoplanes sichuanensis]|uniref:NAD(P)-dependent oxidoreductase n=1 Tax=Actinoplanes sichuanensis TaxID=512349 RepID=A0ABW4A0A1_9ACTN|nr:NAD(P)H-binding protein [Actinoplanes sichuanensis]BEL07993.1 NAD(P)-dependent oxidoreductase [Actinoplanes sichuanensis]
MTSIVIFGAGGRAGRAVSAEAERRGIQVTSVVRDPAKHRLPGRVVPGDILDAGSVAALVAGHDAAVNAVSPASDPEALKALGTLDGRFYITATDNLLDGLAAAGVPRLVVIGLFANLVDADGEPLYDDPAVLPAEFRHFAVAHTAGLDRLRAADTRVDWLVLTPPAQLLPDAPRRGAYRSGGETGGGVTLSYADLAVAVVDEIETPAHHRTRISVFD